MSLLFIISLLNCHFETFFFFFFFFFFAFAGFFRAGPSAGYFGPNYVYVTEGAMQFNTFYLNDMSDSALFAVAFHGIIVL